MRFLLGLALELLEVRVELEEDEGIDAGLRLGLGLGSANGGASNEGTTGIGAAGGG